MNHLNRFLLCVPLLAFGSVACGDAGDALGTGGTGNDAGSGAVTAGAASTTGGTGNTAGTGVAPIPLAGSGQALGGGDQGMLFTNDGAVPIMPPDTAGTGSGGSAPSIPGDGNGAYASR